jgi:hypothetical protein
MSEFWYYAEGSETRGPITFEQLIKLLSQSPTPRGVLVWREGFTDWTTAESVREIVEKLIRPPPLGRRSSAIPPPLPESSTPNPPTLKEETGLIVGLKRKAKMLRESFVAGATNTGNVTATAKNKLVLNWHGTASQRDDVLKMFPAIRDRMMPGVELGSFADAMIANIHDDGMSPDNDGANFQILAMLWRVFTTPLDDEGTTYGDLIALANMHATFELHEQINDQFKITWKISVTRGKTP